jgi:uncharacterized protein (TIGR02246 family)
MTRTRHLHLFAVLLLCLPACAPAPPEASEADITALVESFYGSMKKNDPAAVMNLIAPDAVFLESGQLETRAQYEKDHLPADINFETQVTGTRGPMQVTILGDSAWVIATTEYTGTFDGNPVDFVSAQLMVLSRDSGDWRIRAIHWSARRR